MLGREYAVRASIAAMPNRVSGLTLAAASCVSARSARVELDWLLFIGSPRCAGTGSGAIRASSAGFDSDGSPDQFGTVRTGQRRFNLLPSQGGASRSARISSAAGAAHHLQALRESWFTEWTQRQPEVTALEHAKSTFLERVLPLRGPKSAPRMCDATPIEDGARRSCQPPRGGPRSCAPRRPRPRWP